MTTIGIIGAGEVGSQIARAAIGNRYSVVIANSRGPQRIVLDPTTTSASTPSATVR